VPDLHLSPHLKLPLRFKLATFGWIVCCAVFAASNPGSDRPRFTAKELAQGYLDRVVIAKPHASHRATVDADEAAEGVRVRQKFSRFDELRVIVLEAGDTADAAFERLRATGRYEYVEPDYIRHAEVAPNDPEFARQWALSNTGQDNGKPGADISAPAAWDVLHDAPGVIIAVIDSGVNANHTDIAANLWNNPAPTRGDLHGISYRTDSSGSQIVSGDPVDDVGHGTHVAGTIGAVGNNSNGISGVAWRVQIMALKFLGGSDGTGTTSDETSCLDYAIAHGAHIINASFGENGGTPLSSTERDAIARTRSAGIIFVAAAGNETSNMDVARHYPASIPLDNIVAVGASTNRDELAAFSNYGAAVELFAPGNNIRSLDYLAPNGGTTEKSGTSMAAPHVAGALALLKAKFPADTYRQLINRLLRGVDAGGAFAGRAQTNGRLNLFKALTTTSNAPFNDDFAARPRLGGDNLSLRASNVGASLEGGEPAHGGVMTGATLWWEWVAPSSRPVFINTSGSDYDTVLAVYTGGSLAALAPVVANDDDGTSTTSRVSFTAQAGAAYEIVVGGKNGATGQTYLNLSLAPANDDFATPVTLTGASAHVTATNSQCSLEPGEPLILGNAGGTSLWYAWTAPKSGRCQVSVYSVDFDPLLGIYTGDTLAALNLVAANDNTGPGNSQPQSLCTFDAVAGTTYRIKVDAKNPAFTGEFTLSLTDSLWQFTTGRTARLTGREVTTSPAIAPDGTIVFGCTDKVIYALNPDGTTRWTYATDGGTGSGGGGFDTSSAAIADDGTIYLGASDGKFYALTSAGLVRWTHDFGSSYSASNSPALAADGTIYVKVSDGFLYALNPASGAVKWSYNLNAPSSYASPSVAPDGTIYIGAEKKSACFYALNPDGTLKWSFAGSPQSTNDDVYTVAAIDGAGNVYFGTLAGNFYSLTRDGQLRWTYTGTDKLSTSSSPALSADGATVYFAGYDKRLHAVNTSTGIARWTYQLDGEVRASSPAVDASGVVYVGCYDYRLYAINPNGTLKRTYDTGNWLRSSPAIAGNTLYLGSNDRKLYAFDIGTGVAAGPWPQYRGNSRRTGRVATTPFAITAAPTAQTALIGSPLTLAVVATGSAPLGYQWMKNGAAIAGATRDTLTIANVAASDAGNYSVVVTNGGGATSATFVPVPITVVVPVPGRLVNLSVRTAAGVGTQTLTVGFSVSAGATKPLLIRGVGPGLKPFGVEGALDDPQLRLLSGAAVLAANDNWGGGSVLTTTAASVGAFALDPASKDAALTSNLGAGGYTVQISGVNNTSGIALAELYDTEPTTVAALSRLTNLSARAIVARGSGVLIAGFTISGNVPKTVLIRGIGPALAGFGVDGALIDPKLEIFSGSTKIAENDNWGGTLALTKAFDATGAFQLPPLGKDAALLLTLSPGSYTAQVSGIGGTSGIALIEVYEL